MNREHSIRHWVRRIVAGTVPLLTATAYASTTVVPPPRAGDVLQSRQQGQNNVLSNIYTKKGHSLAALGSTEQKIWGLLQQNHLRAARALIQQTQAQYPGWHPAATMTFVLLEKTIWAQIRGGQTAAAQENMQQLQHRYGHGALASQTRLALVPMRNVLQENRLWQLLGSGHLRQLQGAIQQIQREDPAYRPPQKLLALLQKDLHAREVTQLAAHREWAQMVALHAADPSVFTTAYPENRQAWAQALAATGHPRHAALIYASLLQQATRPAQAMALLDQAAGVLPVAEMQALYTRADAQFPDARRELQRQRLQYVLMMAARAHDKGDDAQAWSLLAPDAAAIAQLHQAGDARLVGAILGANHHPRAALAWWERAARWSGKAADWETVGNLAMANNDLPLAREAMQHLPAGTPASQRFLAQSETMAALRDYQERNYTGTLQHLHAAQQYGPLSSGMETIQAWSLVHTGQFQAASALFTTLYRQDPSSGNAVGVLLTDQHTQNLAHAYQLAVTSGGPLAQHLPMATMRRHQADINQIPWRFLPPDRIAPPPRRQSFLALGASGEGRGGSGMTQMTQYLPSLQAQWGINWHLAAFAELSSPDLYGGQPNATQLPFSNGTQVATATATGHVWQLPQVLVGIDDHEPHHHWRAALGWTSPSSVGGGTVQGLLRYTGIPSSQSGSNWSVQILRNVMRQTLLSYNGVQETFTYPDGTSSAYSWGAAIRNQIGASGFLDGGKHGWSYLGILHLNAITGRNIETNYGATTYLAVTQPLVTAGDWWVTIGPSLYAATYTHNENFASPGYGGYFSPQWMVQPSLSWNASHWWHGGALNVSAAIGYQWLRQAGGPYIGFAPLRTQLQSTPLSQAQPYGASTGGSVTGSINLQVTQRLSTHWFADAGASYLASPAFQQATAGVDIRYVFGGSQARTFRPAQFVTNMGRYQ